MAESDWLRNYYGDRVSKFNPLVIFDGRHMAVVRIQLGSVSNAFSSVGYVGLKKNGRHTASSQTSLFEGIPTTEDLTAMKKWLNLNDY